MIHRTSKRSNKTMGVEEFWLLFFLFFSFSASNPLGAVYQYQGEIPHGHRRSVLELLVNVDDYGARGDGVADDSKAFEKAWEVACRSHSKAVLRVPEKKKYLLNPIVFHGPCKSSIQVEIKGTLEAPSNISVWDGVFEPELWRHWIVFNGTHNLFVQGGGMINGNGHNWWKNSCKVNRSLPCTRAPRALSFFSCKKVKVENLRIKDGQQFHVSFEYCKKVRVSNLFITAPEASPNTDGIHLSNTTKARISDCVIETGDDCISIISGSRKIKATNIVRGPGHGISVGSLGANHSIAKVKDVTVKNAVMTGTENGVRIKTWQGGRGFARKITFQNIVMHNVSNPIIINQNYCDSAYPCPPQQKSAVKVSSVIYRNIIGTSASKFAVKLNCSSSFPCRKITLEDIDLISVNGTLARGFCTHVKFKQVRNVFPPCELLLHD